MAVGFSRLSVSGYRRLRSVDLRLRPLNVLIGANGVGKSSILDVCRLLGASAKGELSNAINEAGAFVNILTADGHTGKIDLGLEQEHRQDARLDYRLTLSSAGIFYAIANEALVEFVGNEQKSAFKQLEGAGKQIQYFNQGRWYRPEGEYSQAETALFQVPRRFQTQATFRHALSNISDLYHTLDVSSRSAVRLPQTLTPVRIPGPNGERLVSCLYTLRETAQDRFEAIEDALHVAFPGFERLEFPPVGAGTLTLGWRERGFSRSFFGNELSEGTLRFLWLATLLQAPELPTTLLIDEPEVSLHPELLRIMTELMRDASERTQLIVATHSDRLVRFLHPEEIIVCDLDEAGSMTTQWANDLNLKAWLEDYTLDQLWSKGILGGRAWPSELR
jgi:predicted ATPase